MSKENIFLCLGTIIVSAFLTVGGRLSVIEDCQWKYPLKSDSGELVGNVTVKDIGTECPVGLDSRRALITPQPDYYRLKVKAGTNARQIYLAWDHDVCYSVYLIQFQAIFAPEVHNESRKCVKIEVKPLNGSNVFYGAVIQFNCLRVPASVSGTLEIKNWRFPSRRGKHCLPKNVDRAYHETRFDIGCPINRIEVRFIGPCLTLEFLGLHRHVSYNRTIVQMNKFYNFSGNDIMRFDENEGTLDLPVKKNEDNVIEITLVCDSYGEIQERTFILSRSVNEECPKYILTSSTKFTTSNTGEPTQLSGVVHITISVVFVIGTVVVVVTVIFVKTRTTRDRSGQSCNICKYDLEPYQESLPSVRMSMLFKGELSCRKSDISPVVDRYLET